MLIYYTIGRYGFQLFFVDGTMLILSFAVVIFCLLAPFFYHYRRGVAFDLSLCYTCLVITAIQSDIAGTEVIMSFKLDINKEYFRSGGVDVMAFSDTYPEGHQSGICVIMHGKRLATNGDVRLEPTPGQWQPVPKRISRDVFPEENRVSTTLRYPDEGSHLRGFNPRIYPDLELEYRVDAVADGKDIVVTVNLDREIPAEYAGKLCFNLELFPGELFGRSYIMDDKCGVFPRQPNGPHKVMPSLRGHSLSAPEEGRHADETALYGSGYSPMAADDILCSPYASGHRFTLCPEDDSMRINIVSEGVPMMLYDGRYNHNNGWFVLSSPLPQGRTENALVWRITPNVIAGYRYKPVIQISNVGYHPHQRKTAVIELDCEDDMSACAELVKVTSEGAVPVRILEKKPWGQFLRYKYITCDFSDTVGEGLYFVRYGESTSSLFRISADVYERGVWQPVMEYFLPVQMCHMRVSEKYRVWHGLCHDDDARMAPVDRIHFDGYVQGGDTLCSYAPGDHVPGLNRGGWHDAGDFDLRVESQSGEAYILSLICEEFGASYDSTTIDQQNKLVEIHQPDGINDFYQQIEHGLLSVLGGYRALGRLYRGIICGDLRQYVLLGDSSVMTDGVPGNGDDRWVFTEINPIRELMTAAHLAACSRVIRDYSPVLSAEALAAAEELYANASDDDDTICELARTMFGRCDDETTARVRREAGKARITADAELYLATNNSHYVVHLAAQKELILSDMPSTAHMVAKVFDHIDDPVFRKEFYSALGELDRTLAEQSGETPYGVPYRPHIWGAGWGIQAAAVRYYFLHKRFPEIFDSSMLFNSLNFVLGTHPGSNTSSFVSGVGTRSATIAYGINRADWSYIPGGVVSGTALIRPDFPELLEFPYLWQQTEYVLGGGSSNYMFLVFAVMKLIENGDFGR